MRQEQQMGFSSRVSIAPLERISTANAATLNELFEGGSIEVLAKEMNTIVKLSKASLGRKAAAGLGRPSSRADESP
jgi:hypothetical protein